MNKRETVSLRQAADRLAELWHTSQCQAGDIPHYLIYRPSEPGRRGIITVSRAQTPPAGWHRAIEAPLPMDREKSARRMLIVDALRRLPILDPEEAEAAESLPIHGAIIDIDVAVSAPRVQASSSVAA